jgi:dephospho-CoA kinase
MNNIVAVVGMCGSGKTVATEQFEKQGYQKVYFGQLTMDILAERKIERTPETERAVREELRASGDKGIYAKMYLPKIRELIKKGNVVIESLYSWSEYKYIKQEFGDAFKVLCIATNAGLRYERLKNRPIRPHTLEESIMRDYSEIENIEKGGPIAIADCYICNNGEIEPFVNEVNSYINSLKK